MTYPRAMRTFKAASAVGRLRVGSGPFRYPSETVLSLRAFSDWGRCSQATFSFYRSGRPNVGLITPVTAWRLNVSKGRQVEIDDGFERVGCRAALEAIGECREPVGVPSLQRK